MNAYALDAENDISLDPVTRQIRRVKDAEEVVQNVRCRLLFYKGEWFLDVTVGVPWFQSILRRPASIVQAEAYIKAEITKTPGVLKIKTFETKLDSATREFTVTFSAETIYGTISQNLNLNEVL